MPSKRKKQASVRWSEKDIESLRHVADKEDRSVSDVIRFFVKLGLEQWQALQSFRALEIQTLSRLMAREIENGARARLNLRTEAHEEIENELAASEKIVKRIRVK